jgi:hypothetical protein
VDRVNRRRLSGHAPRISIVVAPIHTGAALSGALEALEAQAPSPDREVIVPIDSTITGADRLRERFPDVRFVDVDGSAALALSSDLGLQHEAIDRRRSAGLAAADGDIVALTDEYARPRPDWCARLAALHEELPHPVIGGAIENANRRMVNHALFLADVGRYQNPLPGGPAAFVSDLNVSYKRGPLHEVGRTWSPLYNETAVHDALRASGHQLWLSPEPVVEVDRGSIAAGYALREAFAWARLYAGRRVREAGPGRRVALALAAPLLAPLLLSRQLRVAVTRGRSGAMLRCLPFLILVDFARAAGEWTGYVTGHEAGRTT